ncbi:hypothetical protein ACHRV1_24850 [Flavobacterium aquidurense]|uniref:hypothetical protein n=1 Tax=Flavobacterium aquidurense TaxID=362413 RepID=UPI0037571693
MQLVKTWAEFKEQASALIEKGIQISEVKNYQESYENQEIKVFQWRDELIELFGSSFDEKKNEFTDEIINAFKEKSQPAPFKAYSYGGRQQIIREPDTTAKIKDLYQNVDGLLRALKFNLKMLSASDAIIYPEKLKLITRSSYQTDDILELIVEKLYILYDTYYITLNAVLENNGIQLSRHGDDSDLAKILERKGLVDVLRQRQVQVRLTLDGKRYVERKQKAVKPNYAKVDENQEDFNKVIDEILLRLEKLGHGQEIIFDEINELRELHVTLNQKNFGQVVKGKLVDLGLSKLIDNDTLSYIYEKITKETLFLG